MLLRWLLLFGLAWGAEPDCERVLRDLHYPCRCSPLNPDELSLDCDKVVLPGDFPSLPYQAPIVSFTQRWAGNQGIPTQAFQHAGKSFIFEHCFSKNSHKTHCQNKNFTKLVSFFQVPFSAPSKLNRAPSSISFEFTAGIVI